MAEKQDQGSGGGDQGSGDQPKQGQGAGQEQQLGPVPYARFKEVNDQLAALKQQLAAQQQQPPQKEQQSADPDLSTRLATIERELADERANMLRLKVARAAGLPDELAGRLTGANEAELAADAATLAPLLKPKGGPGVPPPPRGGSARALDLATMTPAEIRKARADGKL